MQVGLLTTYRNRYQSLGATAWLISAILFAFYIITYFTALLDPVAASLGLGGRWTLYGVLYTLSMIVGGIYFLRRHGNSRYHRIRTVSVIFFTSSA